MNKIFKVVWNKARNCYVVASEFAKSHTKSGRAVKAVALAAAVALTLGVNGLALADGNIADLPKGAGAGIAIGDGSTTKYETDVAIGKNAYTESEKSYEEDDKTHQGGNTAVGYNAHANGVYSTAIGINAYAEGIKSTALGIGAKASETDSTAIGVATRATGVSSTALGNSAEARAINATALGVSANAFGKHSTAVGVDAEATGDNSTALGHEAKASGEMSMALGIGAEASDQNSISLGSSAKATNMYSMAMGYYSNASGKNSIAHGTNAVASAAKSVAIGYSANASGMSSLALGDSAQAGIDNSVALGANSVTAVAVGTSEFKLTKIVNTKGQPTEADIIFENFAGINPSGTVSIGSGGKERTLTNVAAGRISADSTDAINGSQLFAVADGLQNQINDLNKQFIESDHYHTVNGEPSSTAAGDANSSSGTTTTGTGTGSGTTSSSAGTGASSDTISGSTGTTGTDPAGDNPELNKGYVSDKGNLSIQYATDANGRRYYDISMKDNLDLGDNGSIKFGDTSNTYIDGDKIKVGDTINIDNSTKNISVGKDVNIDMGDNQIHNVAAGTADTDAVNVSQLKQVEQSITNNSVQINKLKGRIDKVGAGAAALAALHPLDFDPDDKFYLSAGYGNYRGENAVAVGAFYQPNDDTLFSISSTVGNDDDMINAGVTWRFGQSSHQSRSKKAMAKEIIELRTRLASLEAMIYSMAGAGLDLEKSKLFPDTPENHWAYDYVAVVAGNGILEGYPDGYFDGDRPMTRYEMAAVVYRLLQKGVQVDNRMIQEFAPEMARVRVDTLTNYNNGTPHIQRVRVIKGRG